MRIKRWKELLTGIALVEPTTLTKQAGVACEIVAAIIDFIVLFLKET